MTPAVIRRRLRRFPFRPLEFVLDNGEIVRITSPEILVFEDAVVTGDRKGRVVLISPDSISMLRPVNGLRGRASS